MFEPTAGVKTIDWHGCTVYQAKQAVDAALRRSRGLYRIRLIHGYHGGTALRDMIRRTYGANPAVLRVEFGLNGGETDLVLREWV